jgi:hypothetical protein
MKPQSSQNIARIKLAELNRQYERLTQHYDKLQKKAHTTTSLKAKLQILYEGLDEIRFAQKKLHPDVENLHVLRLETETDIVSEDLLKNWIERLEKEIIQGKQRLEAGLLFGLTLEDAARQSGTNVEEPGKAEFEAFFVGLLQNEGSQPDLPAFKKWMNKQIKHPDKIKKAVHKFIEEEVLKPVSKQEAEYCIRAMKAHPYHHLALKSEIGAILGNDALINELAGTVTILLNNFEQWDWSKEGVTLNCLWTKHKWRPYNNGDLLHTLFLEVVGMRWGMAIRKILLTTDFWGEAVYYPKLGYLRKMVTDGLLLKEFPAYLDYESIRFGDAYEGYDNTNLIVNTEDTFFNLFQGLNAEIKTAQLQQTQDKAKGLYLLHTDLKDYFLTLPHSLLTTFLEELGVSEAWVTFFQKYFQTPYQYKDQTFIAKQGLSLSHLLSSLLADGLLVLLEKSLRKDGIAMYRYMDDMYIFGESSKKMQDAWKSVKKFSEMTGLQINQDKTGAVLIGAANEEDEFVKGFAGKLPQWMFLELHSDGKWKINRTTVQEFGQNLAKHLEVQPSIFTFINIYNKHISFLLKGLATGFPVGEGYMQEVAEVLSDFNKNLFGNHQSIYSVLRQRIIQKFPEMAEAIFRLPDAWFYWPLTAGGLALNNPMCNVASLYESHQEHEYADFPDLTNQDKNILEQSFYNYYYKYRILSISPQQPLSTPLMEGLMNDFIARGGEVKGSEQKGLSIYWRWLLYTYGHQLLDSLGTFRFLLTELVPLQVIFKSLSGNEEFGLEE